MFRRGREGGEGVRLYLRRRLLGLVSFALLSSRRRVSR